MVNAFLSNSVHSHRSTPLTCDAQQRTLRILNHSCLSSTDLRHFVEQQDLSPGVPFSLKIFLQDYVSPLREPVQRYLWISKLQNPSAFPHVWTLIAYCHMDFPLKVAFSKKTQCLVNWSRYQYLIIAYLLSHPSIFYLGASWLASVCRGLLVRCCPSYSSGRTWSLKNKTKKSGPWPSGCACCHWEHLITALEKSFLLLLQKTWYSGQ